MKTAVALVMAITTLGVLPAALAEPAHTHGAHEHGHAQLNLALADHQLLIEFQAPAADLVGFEHPPRTTAEQQRYTRALQPLQQPGQLFVLPAAAACQLLQQIINSEAGTGDHDSHAAADHAGHEAAGHSDIHASFTFTCQQPGALNSFGVRLFTQYPSLEKISLQAILPTTQTAAELTPANSSIVW